MSVPNELSENVSKLVELSKQIAAARSDIKILTQEEKKMKEIVKGLMVNQGIDTINLRKGKIAVKTSKRTTGFNKNTVKEGLQKYFGGDETKVEGAYNAIMDSLTVKETSSLSLIGIKDKNENDNN